jgi:hypothetical protein
MRISGPIPVGSPIVIPIRGRDLSFTVLLFFILNRPAQGFIESIGGLLPLNSGANPIELEIEIPVKVAVKRPGLSVGKGNVTPSKIIPSCLPTKQASYS